MKPSQDKIYAIEYDGEDSYRGLAKCKFTESTDEGDGGEPLYEFDLIPDGVPALFAEGDIKEELESNR